MASIQWELLDLGKRQNIFELLILSDPYISESCIKIKINLIFLTIFCGTSKGLMKSFKAFIQPFETPQGSVK